MKVLPEVRQKVVFLVVITEDGEEIWLVGRLDGGSRTTSVDLILLLAFQVSCDFLKSLQGFCSTLIVLSSQLCLFILINMLVSPLEGISPSLTIVRLGFGIGEHLESSTPVDDNF